MNIELLFAFLNKHKFVALEYEKGRLTAYKPNHDCDVGAEAGLEPIEAGEFTGPTYEAFRTLEEKLESTDTDPFFLKVTVERFSEKPCNKDGKCIKCEACYEYVAQKNYESGKHVGRSDATQEATHLLKTEAADLFLRGKDDEAKRIRELSAKIGKGK